MKGLYPDWDFSSICIFIVLPFLADKLGRRQKGPFSRYHSWWFIIATAACWVSLCLGLDVLWKGILAILPFFCCSTKTLCWWLKYLIHDSINVSIVYWMHNNHPLKLSPNHVMHVCASFALSIDGFSDCAQI